MTNHLDTHPEPFQPHDKWCEGHQAWHQGPEPFRAKDVPVYNILAGPPLPARRPI